MKLIAQLLVVLFWILLAIVATLIVTKVFVPAVQAQTAPRNAPTTTFLRAKK
jgi:hypothetical protein